MFLSRFTLFSVKGKMIMSKFDKFVVLGLDGRIDLRASVANFSEQLRNYSEESASDAEHFGALLTATLRKHGGKMSAAHLLATVCADSPADQWTETNAKAKDALDVLVASGELQRTRGRNGGVSFPDEESEDDEHASPPSPPPAKATKGRSRKAA